ncbi:MAG: hypothetical protein R3286_07485 [Gammaproteobacteria bacterium]|nr:hypothetical protein [Gammaproteobacteria bacterium]
MKNYWSMSTADLEKEAAKYHISEYYKEDGGVVIASRKSIIDQLLAIENARNMSISRWAMIVSLATAAINVSLTIVNALG